MTDPKPSQVDPVPGAEAEAEAEAAAKAAAEETAEAAKEAEKTAAEATAAAEEAKAAAEKAAPPKTRTEEEWRKRESAKDAEINTYKTAASEAAMQAQIAAQEKAEATAKAKDQNDIDQGLITQAEAKQREQARQRAIAMQPQMEQMGRMMAAQEFGGRHGVNPFDLLSDQSIKTPQQMEAKAKELAQTKSDTEKKTVSDKIETLEAEIKALKEGEPLFDKGQQGAGGPSNLDDMTPEELTAEAYSPREVAKRTKARKK